LFIASLSAFALAMMAPLKDTPVKNPATRERIKQVSAFSTIFAAMYGQLSGEHWKKLATRYIAFSFSAVALETLL
jgi:hypothetical protein